MIDLTPLEVRQKKGDFRRAVRGYDPELVNDFLDLVADRMEELVKETLRLGDRVETLEHDLATFQEKERALTEALMAAQKLREEARSHAEREGELLVREAKVAAEAARDEATRQLAREEEALRQVRIRRGQLVDSFRRMLEREMKELAVIEETLELRGDDPGSRARRSGPGGRRRTRSRGGPGASTPAADSEGGSGEGSAPEGGGAGEEELAEAGSNAGRRPDDPVADAQAQDAQAQDDQAADAQAPDAAADEAAGEDEVEKDWLKSLVEED